MKILPAFFLSLSVLVAPVFASEIEPMVVRHVFEKTNFNENWKVPLATGEETQVVIMSVSPKTNPQNEVGTETHAFDQVIFIISGQAKVILDKKEHLVKKGDMIFVPLGTPHQIINLNQDKPLKLMSVYSQKDMPDVIFKKQADEQ
jgi:mannose-6-phosphate isomerase-like protein (cupin superfamily)